MNTKKLGIRKLLSFIVAGLIGQLAWAIENNYLNVYVYDATEKTIFITLMTVFSAIAATITTLFIGALSDRVGKRKLFVSVGYIIWGVSIVLFAFLDHRKPYSFIPTNAIFLCGTFIVILDCIMTFFGSTANDAAFNAFVTDNTETSNRGKVESVLSILPLVAMIAVVLTQGMLVKVNDPALGQEWLWFFVAFGGVTTLSGIILIFLLPKDVKGPNKDETYFKEMYIQQITDKWGINLSAISNQGKMEKRFDFVIKTSNMIYGIETNFYSGGGSKLNETARSYKTLALETNTIDGFTFVWFTDGKGWISARHNLEETFDVMQHLYNIKDLENNIVKKVMI